MIYPENFEQKIGFTEIRTILKGHCLSSLGTEWIDKHVFFQTDYAAIIRSLNEAKEYKDFEEQYEGEVETDFFDVREPLMRIRPERTHMEELDLFNLKRSLATVWSFVKAFQSSINEEDDNPIENNDEETEKGLLKKQYKYAALSAMTEDVQVFPKVIKRIDAILNNYGKMRDTASAELLSIRHQIEVTTRNISHNLRSIITEAKSSGIIDRDVTPTLRDGRLVIPVAPALKRKIKGIVHDESATGKTVFIEPSTVVDANNKIRSLRAAERREVIRILQELSSEIRPDIPQMMHSLHFLAHVDYLRSLTHFAQKFNATYFFPEQKPRIDWVQAKHPLLELSLTRHGEKIVPLDVRLLHGKRILLISGPNAGGKSVCLKTVGLLQYMLQCGLPVPANECSHPGIYTDIFIDMGDEQSIENDLSTYSSHLRNMKQMIENAGARSLLLIDEFGGGTEPQIGGALAEGILHKFVSNLNYGIITTHYQNLKHFAEQNSTIMNGAMLYDSAEMRPLFQLQVGQPGSSFAIEIAKKMGIPSDIIQYATKVVGKDYVLSDKYVQDIIRNKAYWQDKRRSVEKREQQLADTLARYEREMIDFQQKRREVLAQANADAKHIVESANAQIENTIRIIRQAQAEKERTREARKDLTDFKNKLLEQRTDEDERIARKIAKIQRRTERRINGEDNARSQNAKKQEAFAAKLREKSLSNDKTSTSTNEHVPSSNRSLQVGDYVHIKGQTTVGKIEALSETTARVLFGMMYTQVSLKRLVHAQAPTPSSALDRANTFVSKETRDFMTEKRLNFRSEIDIRGMHVDEALTAISYFIDDAIQLEQNRVRILHGTGTGALRELVRNYLKTVPNVQHFHDEHIQFGGAGITVVEF